MMSMMIIIMLKNGSIQIDTQKIELDQCKKVSAFYKSNTQSKDAGLDKVSVDCIPL